MSDKLVKRAEELRKQLNYHSYRYNVLNDPVVTDYEYDKLFHELRQLEEDNPELVTPDSPTHRVGSDLSEDFPKVQHPAPILSLANAFSPEDLEAWETRNLKLLAENTQLDYVLEPKLDGLSIVITYENGILTQAATRGNGEIGDDVTANIKTIQSVPLRIPVEADKPAPPSTLVVRGEILFHKEAFEALNASQEEQGLPRYVNARNTASGSLKQKDSRETAKRDLTAYIYSIVASSEQMWDTEWESVGFLQDMGFKAIPDAQHYPTLSNIIQQLPTWESRRNDLVFEIDGLVIKVNNLSHARELGVVGKDPRSAIAFKFPSEEATTKLIGMTIGVGRTGKITPTAQLEPVFIGGVTVSNASLHNYDLIEQLDIRMGDTVIVKRSGDVIPYVIGPVIGVRTGDETPITPPEKCPHCDTPLQKAKDGVDWYCPNPQCPERVFRSLEFFVSRGAMDIEGMGPQTIQTLIEQNLIQDEADIFYLEADTLLELEGFAEKKVENLLASIDKAKSRPLTQLLTSLGIDGVGSTVAGLLTDRFHSLDELVTLSNNIQQAQAEFEAVAQPLINAVDSDLFGHRDDIQRVQFRLNNALTELAPRYVDSTDLSTRLSRFFKPLQDVTIPDVDSITEKLQHLIDTAKPLLSIDGLGPILAENIVQWFADDHHQRLIQKMKVAGVNMQAEQKVLAGNSLEGKTFVITGTMSVPRGEIKDLIESNGGKVTGSVSKKTSYVVVGDSPGSKADKAQQLEVTILSEDDLRKLID